MLRFKAFHNTDVVSYELGDYVLYKFRVNELAYFNIGVRFSPAMRVFFLVTGYTPFRRALYISDVVVADRNQNLRALGYMKWLTNLNYGVLVALGDPGALCEIVKRGSFLEVTSMRTPVKLPCVEPLRTVVRYRYSRLTAHVYPPTVTLYDYVIGFE